MNNELLYRIKAASFSIDISCCTGRQKVHSDWLRYIKDVLDECAEEIQNPSGANFVHTGSQYEKLVLKKMDAIIEALYKINQEETR